MSNEYFVSTPTARQSTSSNTPSDLPPLSASLSLRTSGSQTPSSAYPLTPVGYSPMNSFPAAKRPLSRPDSVIRDQTLNPNLHTALVSQILNLQRDRETNVSFIEKLEDALAQAQADNEALQADVRRKEKEKDAGQRQMRSVEDSTLLALEELCRERDAAREAAEDMRQKRESLQQRLRREKEEADSAQKKLREERAKWEEEKRALEMKADIARARLENVLREVAEREAAMELAENTPSETDTSTPKAHDQMSRRTSVTTIASLRPISGNNFGMSLADELANDSEDEDADSLLLTSQPSISGASISPSLDVSARTSIDFSQIEAPVRQARVVRLSQTFSSDSVSKVVHTPERQSLNLEDISPSSRSGSPKKSQLSTRIDARDLTKVLGTLSEITDSPEKGQPQTFDDFLAIVQSQPTTPADEPTKHEYVDTGIQYSARPSPEKKTHDDMFELVNQPVSDIGANQRRKRTNTRDVETSVIDELSGADEVTSVASRKDLSQSAMQSTSTQTDFDIEPPTNATEIQYVHVPVPAITIQSPSGSNSVRTSLLGPAITSTGSQTTVSSFVEMVSTGVQTDKIRVDLRGSQLPEHLKHLLSRTDGNVNLHGETQDTQQDRELITPQQAQQPTWKEEENKWSSLRKSLLQNYAQPEEELTPESLPASRRNDRRQRHGRSFFVPPTPVPEVDNEDVSPSHSATDSIDRSSSIYGNTVGSRPFPARTSSLPSGAERQVRRYSSQDSLGSNISSTLSTLSGPPPPFAIPARRSSRRLNQQYRDDASSVASTPSRRPTGSPKKRVIRKSPTKPVVRRSRTGPAMSGRTSVDQSRSRPSSRPRTPRRQSARPQLDTNNSFFGAQSLESPRHDIDSAKRVSMIMSEGPVTDDVVENNVIDAIAATMVGEFMWKYVKGKSFGTDDFMQDHNKSNAVRHKRWVWISPYEREVLWSNKRPASSAALMGKSGKKMMIQSVFDVKDSTPRPKGTSDEEVCDRSIIIITPSRALKFTAISEERHYLWLTALTYLAKQNSKHDSINLDIPIMRRAPHDKDDATIDSRNSKSSTIAAAVDRSNTLTSATTQTRFPFPFDHRTFSCTTSTTASPSRPVPARSITAPAGDDELSATASSRGFSLAPLTTTFSNSMSNTAPFTFSPAPGDTPVDESDFLECAMPPTVPRLPSANGSSASSLRKKHSNISLRPSSSRARSSVEVTRTSSIREHMRPSVGPRAATMTGAEGGRSALPSFLSTSGASSLRNGYASHSREMARKNSNHSRGPLATSQLAWPNTPPRSSSSVEVEDEYVELDEVDEPLAEAEFASNASFFDAVIMPTYPGSRLPSKVLRGVVERQPIVEEEDMPADEVFEQDVSVGQQEEERRESVDSVAPPSFRTVRGIGAKRAAKRTGGGWRLF